MTTTVTQIADERRLYEMIEQRHREALTREHIRMASAGQPRGVGALLARARKLMGAYTAPDVGKPLPATPVAVTEAGRAE